MKRLPLLLLFAFALGAQTPADELIDAGHWKRARGIVDPLLRKNPNDALANFLGSQISAAFGGRETPLKLAEKAVSLDSRTARYHRQLAEVTGIMAQHANVLQQALLARRFTKEIDRALELDPRDVQALRDRMEFYLLAPGLIGGSKSDAHAIAARISRIDAAEGFAAEARIAAYDRDTALAAGLLRKAVAANPSRYKQRAALAETLLARGESDAAAAAAQEAIALDPTRVTAYSVLAAVLAQKGDLAALRAALVQADHSVPDDLTPHFRAGEALLAAGHRTEAADQVEIYLSQEPEGNEPTTAEAARLLQNPGARAKAERHVPN
jgi:tetratricopeptide (TPR) repeat protein